MKPTSSAQWSVVLLFLTVSLLAKVSFTLQDVTAENNNNAANVAIGGGATTKSGDNSSDELKKFEEYKKSPFYVPPYDPKVISIPDVQHEFIKKMTTKDLDLFRTILREAIDKRHNFAPSVGLMFKYSGKILANFIRNRQAEQKLSSRIDPKASFFEMIASFAELILDKSNIVKKEKGYTKNNIDPEDLYKRVDALFNYFKRTIEISPIGAYIKWNEMVLYKDDPTNPRHNTPIIDEAADLVAIFKAMGYEKTTFVARRIINLLRMFAKGFIPPSEKEV